MNDENPTYVELEVLVPAAHVCFAYSSTDRRNLSTHWHIRRRTDEIGQLTGTLVDGQTKLVNSLAHSSSVLEHSIIRSNPKSKI